LSNYARRNNLRISEAKANFFTEAHERFIEGDRVEIKKYLDHIAHEETSE